MRTEQWRQAALLPRVLLDRGSNKPQNVEWSLTRDPLVVEHHQLTYQNCVDEGSDDVIVRDVVPKSRSEKGLVENSRPRLTGEKSGHDFHALDQPGCQCVIHDRTLS